MLQNVKMFVDDNVFGHKLPYFITFVNKNTIKNQFGLLTYFFSKQYSQHEQLSTIKSILNHKKGSPP